MNSSNEFIDCLNEYLIPSVSIRTLESETVFANKLFSEIGNIVFRDRPDGYFKLDKTIYIFEHFEYDGTKNNKKGSQTRIENNRVNKKLEEKRNIVHDQLNVSHSTEQLRDNFNNIFNHHCNNIDKYISNLKNDKIISDFEEIKIVFCCEDKTTFGCLAYDKEMYAFNVLDIKECLDNILNSKVDYLMLFNSYQNDKEIFLVPVGEQLNKISKHKLASEIKMIDFKPQVIGTSIFISSKTK